MQGFRRHFKKMPIISAILIGLVILTYNNCAKEESSSIAKTITTNTEIKTSNESNTSSGCQFNPSGPLELSIPFRQEDQYDSQGNLLIHLDHSYTNDNFIQRVTECSLLAVDTNDYINKKCDELDRDGTYPSKTHFGWHYDPTNQYLQDPAFTHSDGQAIFPYYAMSDGCVSRVQIDNPVGGNYIDSNVSILIGYGDHSVVYLFEPQGTVDPDDNYENVKYVQETQLKLIVVKEGQEIKKGDLLGYLYAPLNRQFNPTMHFHLTTAAGIPCPSSFFTVEDLEITTNLLQEDFPNRRLCYE